MSKRGAESSRASFVVDPDPWPFLSVFLIKIHDKIGVVILSERGPERFSVWGL